MTDYASLVLGGLYVPLVFYVCKAAYQWGGMLIEMARAGRFEAGRHEPALAMVILLVALLAENIYYGIGRITRTLFNDLSFFLPAVSAMKLAILFAAVLAVDGYFRITTGEAKLWRRIGTSLLLWAAGIAALWIAKATP